MILSYSVNETNQYFSLSEFTRICIHLFNNIQPVHTKVIVTCTLRDESMYIYDKSHNLLSRGTTRVSKGYAVYHRRDRVINHVTDLLNGVSNFYHQVLCLVHAYERVYICWGSSAACLKWKRFVSIISSLETKAI